MISISKNCFRSPLKLGFIPLCDAAPLLIAEELGIYKKYNLNVELKKQIGWATIQDKLLSGELDTSHAIAPLIFKEPTLHAYPCGELVTAMILSTNGNAITISNSLSKACIQNGISLKEYRDKNLNFRKLVFASVYPSSYHQVLLNKWLTKNNLNPVKDVKFIISPPSLIHDLLAKGSIDGFCVGEPWNSFSSEKRTGQIVETSESLDDGHIEKVLITTEKFAANRPLEHSHLIAALLESCKYCEDKRNNNEIIKILSQSKYLNLPKNIIAKSFKNELRYGKDQTVNHCHHFYSETLNKPTLIKGLHLRDELIGNKIIKKENFSQEIVESLFLESTFIEAENLFLQK
jgi:ABC-type nitrate/sulfonate/bicarbonate transport system substrate-binding protein